MEDGMFASKKKSYFVDDAPAATQHPSLILSRQQSELQSGKIRNTVNLNLDCKFGSVDLININWVNIALVKWANDDSVNTR